jgi:hypothetical protein
VIVQYNKITPKHRSLVRVIESKAYIGYIRYLLLKRWPFERVKKELMRLGLAWNEQPDFEIYFKEVLIPAITKAGLLKYYKKYKSGMKDETLTFQDTFENSDKDRISFVELIQQLDAEHFFAEEIVNYYGGTINIPNHPLTGEPLISREKPVDLVALLQNPKRYLIEQLLVEGYSPKQISEHLFQRFDMELFPNEIKVYAKSFFNVKRQDISRLIDNLQVEKDDLERKIAEIKRRSPQDFSFGERFEILSTMNEKIEELSKMIRKLNGVHSGTAFNAAVLEVTDMREIFKDVIVRAHRRFREMDERTEDEVVAPLKSVLDMMAKATDKILGIDDVLNQKTNKTINEEMLEVIMPTLDRIAQEERESMYNYKDGSKNYDEEDNDAIIGFD